MLDLVVTAATTQGGALVSTLQAAAAAGSSVDVPQAALRAAIDVASVALLTLALFLPRHHRRDLVTVFWLFNTAMLCVLLVIDSGQIGVGAGLGLFGVLSIVRLRSEQYRNVEIGYFFVALALALVNGLAPGLALPVVLSAGILVVVLLVDSDRLLPSTDHVDVVLDCILEDQQELRQELATRLHGTIILMSVTQIDYVRFSMLVSVQFRPDPQTSAETPKQHSAAPRGRKWAVR